MVPSAISPRRKFLQDIFRISSGWVRHQGKELHSPTRLSRKLYNLYLDSLDDIDVGIWEFQ